MCVFLSMEEVFQLGLGGVRLVYCCCNGFVRSTFENDGSLSSSKNLLKRNVSTVVNSFNVVETPHSDVDRPSSVDCRESDDCNSTTSTYDSDSRYLLLPASIIAPHAHRADSQIPMSHSTAEDYDNAI